MSINVLIIDDNPPMRELIKMTLVGVAEVVGECSDGSQAMSAYERLRPDWILMDIDMKDLDGISAARQITAAHPAAKVVMVTDYDDYELRRAAREAGAVGYVVKENLLGILDIINA